jgi:signal transduction histidine kinase/ActR/RegA family two-component response regulator
MEEFDDPVRGKRFHEMTFSAVSDAEGRRRWASRISYDVTEREIRRSELAEAQAKLFETQKMETIGQLTGGVAHDFNNLLAAISANLELAQKRAGGDARLAKLLDGAMQGTQRGATLTKRLLAFARRQELKADAVDLRELIAGMQDLLARSLGPGVQIALEFPPDLPPAVVDGNQLELALLNLALNARDAMPTGGALRIGAIVDCPADPELRLAGGPFLKITVVDTGEGMDAETLRRATEPFFTTKGVGKGTGLGLSMAQGLAVQSGGALRIDSGVGRGTQVDVWLPMAEVAPQAISGTVQLSEVPTSARALRVLLVDDDALVAMGTEAMLEDLGHHVEMASSGAAALDLYGGKTFDLVITDHAMPGMTGLALARRLRSLRANQPIILASGYVELPENDDLALPRLAKPFREEELAAAIDRATREQGEPENVLPFSLGAARPSGGKS